MADDFLNPAMTRAAVLVMLRVMRKRNMLKPADLTVLRTALKESRQGGDTLQQLTRILDENTDDRELKRETPRKRD